MISDSKSRQARGEVERVRVWETYQLQGGGALVVGLWRQGQSKDFKSEQDGSVEWVKGVGRWHWALGGSRAWVCDGKWRNWSSQWEEMKSVRTNWGERGATGRNGEGGERKNKIKYSNLVWIENKIIYIFFLPLSYSAHLSLDVHRSWEANFFLL